jgi:fluoroquinolone transport system permease protein
MSKTATLLRRDARGIYRDSFLFFLCVYAPVIALALRLGSPRVPIEHLELYLAPWIVSFGASAVAVVFGFGMIEEREQQTALLLRVLPLSRPAYFSYLVATTGALSFVLGLLAAVVYGQPVADLPGFLGMTAAASLLAPLGMLLLAVVARNKIEGMALAKILSSASFVPALAFVLPPGWQLLLVWSPHYWAYLGLLRCYTGESALAGLAVHWPIHSAWLDPLATVSLCLVGVGLLARLHRSQVV